MTTAQARFETALAAAQKWRDALPPVAEFCVWPNDVQFVPRAPVPGPAADLLKKRPGTPNAQSTGLMQALQGIAEDVEWRHTYTAEELGQHFLDNYGWFELAGPDGHFITHQTRITVGYWGPDLVYPRHQHGPAELYTVVSGSAVFQSDGDKDATLGPCQTRLHAPHQPHAMITTDHPVLTLVFWRGSGLDEMPRLTR